MAQSGAPLGRGDVRPSRVETAAANDSLRPLRSEKIHQVLCAWIRGLFFHDSSGPRDGDSTLDGPEDVDSRVYLPARVGDEIGEDSGDYFLSIENFRCIAKGVG